MKRFCSILLLLCMLLWAAVPVRAEADAGLVEKIKHSLDSGEMVDIHSYHKSVSEMDVLYDEIYYGGQLPWYAEGSYSYTYTEDTRIVQEFKANQLDPEIYDRDLYEQKMAELIAETCLPGMSDWQMVLSVHEYIVLHTIYDESLENHTGYDSLVSGSAVCQGYSMLFMDVMNRLGIPCQVLPIFGTRDNEGHGWNLVQLDGQWYHVDLTWDDPSSDIYGSSRHVHFLKTDQEFRTGSETVDAHDYEWNTAVTIAETPYTQDDFLEDVVGAVCFVDADTMIFRREGETGTDIISRNVTTGEETVLYSFEWTGMDLGDGTYLYPTYGLNYWNGRVYFNREKAVMSMLPDGSDLQQVYTLEMEDRYVIGAMADEGILYLTLSDKDFQQERMEVPLEGVEFHRHSYELYEEPATCLEDGYSQMICECDIFYNPTVLEKTGHDLQVEVIEEADFQQDGMLRIYCANCDHEAYEVQPRLIDPKQEVRMRLEDALGWISGINWAILVAIIVPAVWLLRSLRRANKKKRSRSR